MPSFGSRPNQPMAICMNERVGMWSQSKMATNSPVVFFSAALMLPALAWRLLSRVTWVTPTSSQNTRNSSRRPSSSTKILILSRGQSMDCAASTVERTTDNASLYVGMNRSMVGHSAGSSGSGTGLRSSGQAVCT